MNDSDPSPSGDPEESGSVTPLPSTGAATIDAPEFNKEGTKLDLEARSIKTTAQAWQICTTLEQNNRQRALRTADIQSIHDGEPPRSAAANAEKAKAWQANFSSLWLAGIVGRQAQRFVNAIVSQTYLTYSRLPDRYKDAKSKSDLMQAKFTRLVRADVSYTGTVNSLSVENVLQGYTYAVFLDPFTSKPVMVKQDRLYLPEQAQQHASELQFFCMKEDYRLDKFLDLWAWDADKADNAGYDIDACEKAANQATMQDPREDATTTQFRKYADMINEGTLGLSYSNTGERVVKVWLLFNREYDGQVSFWMIDRDNGTKLRFSFKLFKKMEDIIAMFSFEPGNGCIHSSKGLGRKLAALAVVKELYRCGMVDQARIAALTLLKTDSKDRNKIAPSIIAPFIYIDKSIEVSETQFPQNMDGMEKIDQLIDQWAEQAVGAYLASQAEESQPEKTATQATIEAKREQEAADIQIRRWLDHYFGMIQVQQLRAFSDDNVHEADRIAKAIRKDPEKDKPEIYKGFAETKPEILECLVEILNSSLNISPEEIKCWRSTPASVFAHVSDAVIQQGIDAVFQLFKGDPRIDQDVLYSKKVEGMVGAQDAGELVIPTPDQTVVIEAERMQYEEASSMANNLFKIGVSPRDNHLIHGGICMQLLTKLAPLLSQANPDPKLLPQTELVYNHLAAHLNMIEQIQPKQMQDPKFIELEKFFAGFGKQLKQVIQIHAEQAAAGQAVAAKIRNEGLPPQPAASGTATPQVGAPAPTSAAADTAPAPALAQAA